MHELNSRAAFPNRRVVRIVPRSGFLPSLLVMASFCWSNPATVVLGEVIKLEWDPLGEPVGGYNLYYGFGSKQYVTSMDVGDVTQYEFDPTGGCGTYFFSVTAYDVTRQFESFFSNEITATVKCSLPSMWVDRPMVNATVGFPFQVAGWAADLGETTGTGVDAVHVWAFPSGQEDDFPVGTFLGSATLGISRPDVSAFFGNPNLVPSGYRMDVVTALPAGKYDLIVYARSTVTGTFNNAKNVPITVPTTTQMALDVPIHGTSTGIPFTVAGWAFDTRATTGAGIDSIHIWAFPSGQEDNFPLGTFLGSATRGISRPDVAVFFNNPNLELSGYRLDVTTPLPDGRYTLKAYARNTLNGAFEASRQIAISIVTDPRLSVDTPLAGSTINGPFQVSGWAVDLAATAGTGVEQVHVWTYPRGNPASSSFLGIATYGLNRPDVGTHLGDSRFDPSGFRLDVNTLPPAGDYVLQVFALSSVTGTFNNVKALSLAIRPAATLMWLDAPTNQASVSIPFNLSGWAFNPGATSGAGIDQTHVWAFPSGQEDNFPVGTFLGSATLGISRPDVAAFYGDPDLEFSGFRLDVTSPLEPGSYTLKVYVQSTVTGTFDNAVERPITLVP